MTPYFETELGKLYHGDCLEIMKEIPDGSVDLVLTDPPYNVGFRYEGYDDTRKDWVAYFRPVFAQLSRIAKTILISTGTQNLVSYAQIEPWKWLLAWHKPACMGRSPVGFNNFEPIAMWGRGCKNGTDVIVAPIIVRDSLYGHPCPKPLMWAEKILQLFKESDSVLDPFIGSGTTAVACERLNRRWIGIEIEERYCEIAAKRIQAEANQGKLFQVKPEPMTQEALLP